MLISKCAQILVPNILITYKFDIAYYKLGSTTYSFLHTLGNSFNISISESKVQNLFVISLPLIISTPTCLLSSNLHRFSYNILW